MRFSRRLSPLFAAALFAGTVCPPVCRGEPTAPSADGVEFFETNIRPVLVERCYECHSAKSTVLQGGLRLDSAERMRSGGDSGQVIVPHKPEESLLIAALRYESLEMPPTGKLPQNVIDDFVKWISLGAPDPRSNDKNPAAIKGGPIDPRSHWAFQRPQRPAVPKIRSKSWARSDLDRFVVEKLEVAGLVPSPQADPRTLLRRLYYDLIGLPPTADELAAFEADPSDARYEAAVDWLLASPRFGERWARYWLDVARYADTKGYVFTEDRSYKHAYRYRDWVIDSFNGDRPYDDFVLAQLAADQIEEPKSKPAIGFLTLGRRFLKNRHDIINDRIDVVTRGLLGLTVACARCHDHKYDPIPTEDYYALYGVFASADEKEPDDAPPVLADGDKPFDPVIFLRGNPGNPGPKVDRHFVSCLSASGKAPAFQHGSGRREMAEAIARSDNPLTARVWVNRVWGHLFGTGLVATPSDFGTRGTPPTHPELLDWLACEFMDSNWSTKRLIRNVVTSSTYRQASDELPERVAADPENRLLWRANRRRLDLESVRDSLVAAAGRLDLTLGGPSVQLTAAPFSTRRAAYGFIERQNLPAFFRTFDFANPNEHVPQRPETVAPQQALFFMNSPFVIEQAAHLAKRSKTSPDAGLPLTTSDEAAELGRITRLFEYALGREPVGDETGEALEFVRAGDDRSVEREARWERLAQVLLMSNEFAFVD
jgi:uncharacterized protein DUF1553/uncharacterized protein DUF1549/cytochrome c